MKTKDKKIAVFSGTFDPVTVGHTDIIKRACLLFDEVHVLVALNPEKKTLFSENERFEFLRAAVNELDCANKVVCAIWERPVFEYCKKVGADYIVKGIRNSSDFDYEKTLAKQTSSLCVDIETVLLFSDSRYDYISSSYVRGCIEYCIPLSGSVPESAVKLIEKIKKERNA